jgi:MFS family permease
MKLAMRQAPGGQEPPPVFMAVILTFAVIFLAIFLIVLPIIFLTFYRKKDVWETCRHKDPVERWTERAPLPILAASLFFLASGCMSIPAALVARLFPFFGTYLVGIPACIILVLMACADFYLAWAFYRVQLSGWYVALIVRVLAILSVIITTLRNDLMNAYVKLGMSSQELRVLNSSPITHSKALVWFGLTYGVLFLGYLIWLKKYFNNSGAPQTTILASE